MRQDLEQDCTEIPTTRFITGSTFDLDGVLPIGILPWQGTGDCVILNRCQVEELITHLKDALNLPNSEYPV